MKLHHLRPAPGAVRGRKRVGRGRAAGQGKTAGRGTKGLKARGSVRPGFEGGQMPLQRRVPKLKGFSNPNRREWAVVNVDRLGKDFEPGTEVTPEALRGRGLAPRSLPIKVLGRGRLDHPLIVRVHAVSRSARSKIEQSGGTVELL